MYRRSVRTTVLLLALAAAGCGPSGESPPAPNVRSGSGSAMTGSGAADAGSGAQGTFADLPTALAALIPADARVLGFGELHARTDRAQVRSALERFTHEGLPGLSDRLSDLVIETWVQDKACGAAAAEATARVEITMRRPLETKSEIAQLAEAARAAKVQPHAMTITCADYARIAPAGKDVDPEAMLALTTRELGRITTEVLAKRDGEPGHRPWIAVYGGALHNDRFPEPGTEDWSYAAAIDRATGGELVEFDLIVPEYAAGEPMVKRQPWYALVEHADNQVHVWRRGERSFVLVLPRTP